MSKSVLTTITEYAKDPESAERLATADLELELCDRMVDMRERAGLTQKQLGELVGCTQPFVAKLENGAYGNCTIGTLRAFARALGHDIDIDHLLISTVNFSRPSILTRFCSDAEVAIRGFINAPGENFVAEELDKSLRPGATSESKVNKSYRAA